MTTDSGSSDLWIPDEGVEGVQAPEAGQAPQPQVGEAPQVGGTPQVGQPADVSAATPATGSAHGMSVVAAAERADYESKWAEIQARFVDDPGDAVDQARLLATEVARVVTRGIADRLAALDQHASVSAAPRASATANAAPSAAETAPREGEGFFG